MTKTIAQSGSASIKPEDIEAIIEVFQASDWDELHLEIDGLELFLSNDPAARSGGAAVPGGVHAAHAAAPPAPQGMGHIAPPPAPPVAPRSDVPLHWLAVTAPNLGTFYRSPKPGAAPYVEIGQAVEADTEICLIEVMKLFTAVRAGVTGIVRRICANDAEMVEFGQTLFYIEPA
jgi:acetyl-CoA carboxylase biotin carboxyl carrier protein